MTPNGKHTSCTADASVCTSQSLPLSRSLSSRIHTTSNNAIAVLDLVGGCVPWIAMVCLYGVFVATCTHTAIRGTTTRSDFAATATEPRMPRSLCALGNIDGKYAPCPPIDGATAMEDSFPTYNKMSSSSSRDANGGCRPREDWRQIRQYPTCNTLHERLDSISSFSIIAAGTTTEVFEMINAAEWSSDTNNRWVFKMNKFSENQRYENKKAEATLLEHLSASPYIPTMYGFCATSMLNPYASSGTLYYLIKSLRMGGPPLIHGTLDMLKISVQAASGLAALHDADEANRTAFAHNDLDVSQYLYNEETKVYQLSDFNYGQVINYDPSENLCKERSHMIPWKYRAPEDLAATLQGGHPFDVAKADIYSLGTVLYMVLTKGWVWESESRSQSARRIMRGERPALPKALTKRTDRAVQAVIEAIDMCWRFDPDERPSAQEVAGFLRKQLNRIQPREEEVKIMLPPLLDDVLVLDDDYDNKM